MDEYNSTEESRLWHAVLGTYLVDALQRNMDRPSWSYVLQQARSEWTKTICDLINLDHDFFIEKLLWVKANRHKIAAIHGSVMIFKDDDGRSGS